MGERPLRQHYEPTALELEVDPRLGDVVGPWRRHRDRLLEALGELDGPSWTRPTRCDAWSVRDVVNHLVSADGFWIASFAGVAAGAPTTYLRDFDPTTTPAEIVAGAGTSPPEQVLDQLRVSTEAFAAAVDGLDADGWERRGESPVGHVAAPLVLAHAHWDSWVHERDIFVPLDRPPPVEEDELAVAAWYTLLAGAVEGGLPGDPDPVGDGLEEPLEVDLRFEDLPALPLHLRIEAGRVAVSLGKEIADRITAGRAVDFVDGWTGRDEPDPGVLPAQLAAHLERAFRIL